MPNRRPVSRPLDDPRMLRAENLALALAEAASDPVARREFLARMGAAIALAGLSGCTRAPNQEIVPYVVQPPEVTPGVPRHYATATTLDGYATGVVVESHEGRPTKVEGNPEHPASLGAASVFDQASVLSLYDPTRARAATAHGSIVGWELVARVLREGRWTKDGGRGLHILLEPTSSPTVVRLLETIHERLPRAVVSFHSPTSPRNAWEGARIVFGRILEPRLSLEHADVIVALDADLLGAGPASLRLARQFADRRDVHTPADTMNRLYVVEALYSITGAGADHRLRVRASDVRAVAAALAVAVGLPALPGGLPSALTAPAEPYRGWIEAVARDLRAHRGRSVVVAGDAQPPEVHALAHAINAALENLGATVTLGTPPIFEAGGSAHGLDELAGALAAGEVDTLVVSASNPVYTSPAARDLGALFARARQSVYLGHYEDETAAACTHVLPRAHPLECWGDARAFDGTLSVVQPLVEPLFGGRSELDLLALFADKPRTNARELVRAGFGDDREWRSALRRGFAEGSAFATTTARIDWFGLATRLARIATTAPPADLELIVHADPRVHDGRFANNAWLLELPSPIVALTWTNAATLAPETATKRGLTTGDEIVLRAGERTAKAIACVVPGQAPNTIGLSLGWGRTRGAELARGRGANAYALAADTSFRPLAVELEKTGARRDLPITQTQRHLEGRDADILQHRTLAEQQSAKPAENGLHPKRRLSLYEREPPAPWQWGMAIDLSRCTGCGACVIACQAENNIPTVGPDNVILNREMHWLRIDSYFVDGGNANETEIAAQPMLCQHCESAPCEYVCPVNATVHSDDGLNEMVYNRCVGTRFCSNNCPYKVRRFNWFDFHRGETAVRELVHNPDVTVRERGVMEKCTFCVQRLREWEIKKQQGRKVEPPRTACQQTCPAQAIVFGDLHAAGSEVKRLHESPRAYEALGELGTEPRVRYLARIKNPNPELS
ncbi:MAG: Molybdopterin oxidoreductase, iron-sulfur binding subunit [Labilithrix sp.]|nr:Molybdopterin oxidoreductase, iron-sulfur binding subunit [Labilithrix sp.]